MIDVDITFADGVPRGELDDARRELSSLERFLRHPPEGARLTVRRVDHPKRPYVADASLLYDGRYVATHATGRTPLDAVRAVVDRMRHQLRRSVGAEIALRDDPRAIRRALEDLVHDIEHRPQGRKPPEERRIVHRRTYAARPESTYEAISDMLDDDLEFLLFVHVRTNEDVVVHRCDGDDLHVGLLHPPGSVLADEGDDLVIAHPSRFPDPIPIQEAREAMDIADYRWLYFIDAADERGKVLYQRHDGDLGLVEPE